MKYGDYKDLMNDLAQLAPKKCKPDQVVEALFTDKLMTSEDEIHKFSKKKQ